MAYPGDPFQESVEDQLQLEELERTLDPKADA